MMIYKTYFKKTVVLASKSEYKFRLFHIK
uniref:Uncharacterized protein n=1 Tax=Anguilla anguilla TaxID=7936 RepID=A0A0E9XNA5_ANGAN